METVRDRYTIENLKDLYNRYSFKPIPSKVTLVPDDDDDETEWPKTLKVTWCVRDTAQIKTISFQNLYTFQSKPAPGYRSLGLPEEQSEATLQATSLDGRRSVLLKTRSDGKNSKSEQFIVVYERNGGLCKTIAVKSINDELTVVENPNLSGFLLNQDGTILVCVVEIQEKANKDESPATAKEYNINGHEYKQSWGEKFNTVYHTSIAVIALDSQKYVLLDKVGLSLCQPFLFKSKDAGQSYSIGCIGFQEVPYKLGLIYCTNRVSYLFGCHIPADLSGANQIEPEMYYGGGGSGPLSVSSPRVHHNANDGGYDAKVVFLERDAGGAHNKAARLQQFDLETRKIKTIRDDKIPRPVIKQPDGSVTYSDVGPIFASELPQKCFTPNGQFVVFESDMPFHTKPLAIRLHDGAVQMVNFPTDSCQILEIRGHWIFAIGSSINQLPNIYIGRLPSVATAAAAAAADGSTDTPWSAIKWIPVEQTESKILPNIRYGTFMFASKNFPDKYVTGIWTSPVAMLDQSGPAVIIPHGGPHAHYYSSYYQSISLYSELQLKTCLVNYVGSIGVDQEYVDALLGNVGTTDVQDVVDAISYMIDHHHADKDRIILHGGSHGGFLVTHLSGQHAEMNFLACVARNPVIDVGLMMGITDIPDWNVTEALAVKEFRALRDLYPRNADEMAQMYRVSPLSHIGKVKVPTLLLLGNEDLRVPYPQGLLYHRLLKARGVESRCLVYDDVHDLQKINVNFDCFINFAKFIEKLIYYDSQ